MSIPQETIAEVREQANRLSDKIIALRREFHQFPELSWNEFKTSQRIVDILKEDGVQFQGGICGTGVVAEIEGLVEEGKTVAVRADMDALPMQDTKQVPYASRIPGVMHACGHDCHMAIALGVVEILNALRDKFRGKIRFIFQPSEEAFPSGAHELVKTGVMTGVDAIFALHMDPEIEAGSIGLRSGVLTANANEFKITILGKSGHAARPHQSIDTIHVANQVLTSLYDIVSCRSRSHLPAVITVGKFVGGTKSNVIPERVDIGGTIRTVDRQTNLELEQLIEQRVSAITESAGARYQLEFPALIPAVNNDAGLINLVDSTAESILGRDKIKNIANVSMGGEDFAWFLDKAPGALIRLGGRKSGEAVRYLHTNSFDVNEESFKTGMEIVALSVLKYLSQ